MGIGVSMCIRDDVSKSNTKDGKVHTFAGVWEPERIPLGEQPNLPLNQSSGLTSLSVSAFN